MATPPGGDSVTLGFLGTDKMGQYLSERSEAVRDKYRQWKQSRVAHAAAIQKDTGTFEMGKRALRVYTSGRDLRRTIGNQTAERIERVLPTEVEREALNLMRDFKGREAELTQFLDGTHPEYQQGIDYKLLMQAEDLARTSRDEAMLRTLGAIDASNPRLTAGNRAALYNYTQTDAAHWNAIKQSNIREFQSKKAAVALAQNPTKALHRANAMMTLYFGGTLKEGTQLGLFKSGGKDVNQYVNRYYMEQKDLQADREGGKVGPAYGASGGGSTPTRRFVHSKQRVFDTIGHAIANGQRPATYDAADLMRIYANDFSRKAATLEMMDILKKSKSAKWAFSTSDKIPVGWQTLQFGDQKVSNRVSYIDQQGQAVGGDQNFYVPEKVIAALRPITEPDRMANQPIWKQIRQAQRFIKSVNLGYALFHEGALTVSGLNNMGPVGMTKAITAHMDSPEFRVAERGWISDGMTTTITGDSIQAYRRLKPGKTPTWVDVVSEAPVINEVQKGAELLTKLTFDITQRKFKVYDATFKDAKWMKDHPNATELEHRQARRGIAKEVNSIYGGMHWENLGVTKTAVEVARAFLLAPDWTFSNIASSSYAAGPLFSKGKEAYYKKRFGADLKERGEDRAAGAAARHYMARSMVYGLAANQAMSLLLSGKLSSNPTQVYMGKDKDGREIYQDLAFRGAPHDIFTLVNDVRQYGPTGIAQFMLSKAAPGIREGIALAQNRNWMGQRINAPELGWVEKTVRDVEYVAPSMGLPFSIQNIQQIMLGPEYENDRAREAITTLFGSRPRHVAPIDPILPVKSGAEKLMGRDWANKNMSGNDLGKRAMRWDNVRQRLVPDTGAVRKEQRAADPRRKLSFWDRVNTGHPFATQGDLKRKAEEKRRLAAHDAAMRQQARDARTAVPPGQ